ncbi:tail fiber protein [uncultured Psychroserpens sp.]|uniref:phage tail protein n=1 Tax=uncultured Psychroserpens sp. TaxID=255436 RepID=UPI0026208B15|nr:tail fiber protein [uncultured Psychroserpens sp.]
MEQYIGQIMMFGGNFAPRNWALCDGQLLPIANYTALFSILGTTYGGDGRTTFALPDLRGRAALHAGNGPGIDPVSLGQKGGENRVTLNVTQIPAHSHTGTIEATNPVGRGQGTTDPTNAYPAEGGSYASAKNVKMAADAVQTNNTGGNQAHDNMQPYLGVNYIIALEGIFPPRS